MEKGKRDLEASLSGKLEIKEGERYGEGIF